jgi:hypothetical protein
VTDQPHDPMFGTLQDSPEKAHRATGFAEGVELVKGALRAAQPVASQQKIVPANAGQLGT